MRSQRPKLKTRREKRRRLRKRIITVSLSVVIIITSIWVLRHKYFSVQNIEVKGNTKIIHQDIIDMVDDYLNQFYFGIFPKNNILLLNTTGIEKTIKNNFPHIQELSVSVQDGDTVHVVIDERKVHSLWCIDREYESVFDEECYFADRDGLLYARAPYFSGSVYPKLFIPSKENADLLGYSIQDLDSFAGYFDFLDALENDYPVRIGNSYIDTFGDISIEIQRLHDVSYDTDQPLILYNQSRPYNHALRDIGVILDFTAFKKEFKIRAFDLQSLDVRFENKAVYTFTPLKDDET